MSNVDQRRRLVALGFTLSILAAAVAIRLAAGWTASAAPLSARPEDAAQIAAELEGERARAVALAEQLAGVSAQAAELRRALEAAADKADADASTAKRLAGQLKEARERLASLQAQLAAPPPATVTVLQPAAAGPASSYDEDHEEEDHEDEDHEDEDHEDEGDG
ncbi:MAG TPA: hypothetical protein VH859_03760 [Candidatus Limnocylindria bacterium]|jgi:hypothetical protein